MLGLNDWLKTTTVSFNKILEKLDKLDIFLSLMKREFSIDYSISGNETIDILNTTLSKSRNNNQSLLIEILHIYCNGISPIEDSRRHEQSEAEAEYPKYESVDVTISQENFSQTFKIFQSELNIPINYRVIINQKIEKKENSNIEIKSKNNIQLHLRITLINV